MCTRYLSERIKNLSSANLRRARLKPPYHQFLESVRLVVEGSESDSEQEDEDHLNLWTDGRVPSQELPVMADLSLVVNDTDMRHTVTPAIEDFQSANVDPANEEKGIAEEEPSLEKESSRRTTRKRTTTQKATEQVSYGTCICEDTILDPNDPFIIKCRANGCETGYVSSREIDKAIDSLPVSFSTI
ncbi:hypothetical protein D9758_011526 [Tetrapyrgos nigripes]|uniref:Uncharacterized protein n=1 Tax=Tetrapyrgos nigripes TaxID=182062 RepID=A0A8H5CS26_9AGAR|nr:hypothetical protein D9758_011526 [Tetrapyrgos nigripes]